MSKSIPAQESTSHASLDRLEILRDRSAMFTQVRNFFSKRGVCEVDCPLVSSFASVDAHIDLITAHSNYSKQIRYLNSSPEYAMKRLLSEGIGDIYQLSHVFRDGEVGHKHNPEFTMLEWYRLQLSYQEMIEETAALICLFLGRLTHAQLTYRQALQTYAGCDPYDFSNAQLLDTIHRKGIATYPGIEKEGKDNLLNIIMGAIVEPQLGKEGLLTVTHFPASQAALAKIEKQGDIPVALRFETYYRGTELANGYCELTNPEEQRLRLIQANHERQEQGKSLLPIDENFLKALEKGLPECSGVAVGFDRLMMLRHNKTTIVSVIPFDWSHC